MNDDWMKQAACRGAVERLGSHDLFFPRANTDRAGATSVTARAKAVCAECPVKAECLADEHSLTEGYLGELSGVRAGMSEQERRIFWRHYRRCKGCSTCSPVRKLISS